MPPVARYTRLVGLFKYLLWVLAALIVVRLVSSVDLPRIKTAKTRRTHDPVQRAENRQPRMSC